MSELSLSVLKPGAVGVIKEIAADEVLHHRLQSMGFRIGREVKVIRQASFKGPLQLRIGTTEIIMREGDAGKIRVLVTPSL
jgi:ferrous iron transport protein A